MISRFDFIKDVISSDNPTYDFTHHFNEISVLYGIFGGRSDIDIFASKERGRFGFSILLEKEDEAQTLKTKYDGFKYNVYGETYRLKAKLSKADTVFISMAKEKEA